MERFKYLFLLLSIFGLSSYHSFAQVTIYNQDFTATDGTTSGAGWSVLNSGGCGFTYDFGVVSNEFRVRRARGFDCGCNGTDQGNNQNIVEFGPIDISNHCDVEVSLVTTEMGNMECGDNGAQVPFFCDPGAIGHDMLWVEVIIDGTSQTMRYYCGNILLVNNPMNGLAGNSMTIRITSGTQANSEIYTIDDLLVEGVPAGGGSASISVSPGNTICDGTSVTLTAQGSGPYDWNTGASTQTITVSPSISSNYSVTVGTGCAEGVANEVITVLPQPNANAGANKTICRGENTTLQATGGTSYNWSTGQSGSTISVAPLSTKSYTVTVTSGPGCTDTDQVTVFVNNTPNVSAGSNQSVCEGEPVILTATGASSYFWSNNMSGSSITFVPTSSGTYTVTGTTNGCDDMDQVSVTLIPNPSANISGANMICEGGMSTLTGSGGGAYNWSTGSTNDSIIVNPTSPTTYTLTVTNSGCTDTASFEVGVQPTPIANAGSDEVVCIGDPIILTANGGSSYAWSEGSTSQSISLNPTADITYTVTVTNGMCSDTDDVNVSVVPLPTANITGDLTICEGASTLLIATGSGTYSWNTNETSDSIVVSPSDTTDYILTVTQNGCSQMDTATVIVSPNPIANAGSNITICQGEDTTLQATGGTSYNWSSGQSGESITVAPDSTITYTVTVTSGSGCIDTDQVTVTVNDPPSVSAGTNQSVCDGDSITLMAAGASSYSWSNNMSGSSITFIPTSSETYTVTGTTNGCNDTAQVSVTLIPNPSADITGANIICEGGMSTLTGSGGGAYNWSTGSTNDSIIVSPTSPTTYTLTVTNNGCMDTTSYEVGVAPPPIADAGADEEICVGDSLTLTANGGSSYIWSDGSTSQSIRLKPTSDITYTVTVSNGMCSDSDDLNVSVVPLPTANITGDLTICEEASTLLIATGSGTYSWNTNETSDSIEVAPTTTTDYILTVTQNGCSQMDTATIVVTANPIVNAGSDITVCEDEIVTLNASGADNYSWSNSEMGSSIMITATTNQTLTVTGTSNGCSTTDDIILNVQPKIIANAGVDQDICSGSEAILSASGGISYEWSEGTMDASTTVSPTISQTYSVTATDGLCTATDEIEIRVREQFTLQSTPDSTICSDSTIRLTSIAPEGVSFNWSTGQDTKDINVQPSTPTTYSVTATDGICVVTNNIVVDIDDINLSLSADVNVICQGDVIEIDAASNGRIMWPDGSDLNTRAFSPTSDTSFLVSAISQKGCIVEANFDLSVNPLPTLSIDGQPYFCIGNTTEIIASSGLTSYIWTDGNTEQSRTISTSGTYSVQGEDVNGCISQASITIEQYELPEPIILGSRSYCPGSATELSIDQNYASQVWTFGNDVSSNPTYNVSQNGSVHLEVTDTFGCMGSIDAQIESNPDLSPIILGEQTLCENTTGQLNAGSGFDNYLWSTGSTTSTIEVSSANTYSVTVSNNDGCIGTSSVNIAIDLNPTVDIQGNRDYCIGESTVLHIDDFLEIRWSNGSTNDSIVVSAPGTIMVEVMDINGCSATEQVTIAELPLPHARIDGDTEFCAGDSTQLELKSDNRNDITSIEWDNMSISDSIFAKESAERSVMIEDRFGCKNTATISVTANANPVPRIVAPTTICEGAETKIYTTHTFDAYLWKNGIQSDTQMIAGSGAYEVLVTDENGCQGSDNVTIDGSEPPSIAFKSGLTFCNSQVNERPEPLMINLDTAFAQTNVSGNWYSSATQLDLTNLPIIDFEGVEAGLYEFTYTSTNATSPCENISRSVTLEVLNCQCPNVQFQVLTPLCSLSDILDLSTIQSSDFEGSWQIVEGPSSTLPSIEDNVFNAIDQMPGSYRLEFRLEDGIAPLGCAETKSVNLQVAEHIDASIELVNPACGGNEATFQLSLSGGTTFDVDILQDNGQLITLEDISDGHTFDLPLDGPTALSFSIISSDRSTCGFKSSSSVFRFEPSQLDVELNLAQNFGDFAVSCSESADGSVSVEIISGNAPFTYNWSTGAATSMIDGLSSGSYTVTVQDGIGCEFISTVNVNAPPVKQLSIQPEDPRCGQGPGRLVLNSIAGIRDGQWEFYIDGVLRSETQVPVIFSDIASGNHTLEAVNEHGCLESHSFNIKDNSAFAIDLEDITIGLGESTILRPNINFDYTSISWSPSIYLSDSSSSVVAVERPLNTTLYTITIVDVNGCVITDIVNVHVDKERALAFPTGFTPNSDANNDAFIIHAKSDVVVINSVSVYDRSGEQVFTAENVEPNQPLDWDWTFRSQPLPAGQYVWHANAKFIDSQDIQFSGKFYILR